MPQDNLVPGFETVEIGISLSPGCDHLSKQFSMYAFYELPTSSVIHHLEQANALAEDTRL